MSVVTAAPTVLRLDTRAPFDGAGVLRWLAARAVPGIEEIRDGAYRRTLRLPGGPGVVAVVPRDDHVRATLRVERDADLDAAVAACRRLLDLDADPRAPRDVLAADPALAPLVAAPRACARPAPSTRPRAPSAPSSASRSRSPPRARSPGASSRRAAAAPGEPDGPLTHVFPAPEAIADERVLAAIGMPGARQRTLHALCAGLAAGDLVLDGRADPAPSARTCSRSPGSGRGRRTTSPCARSATATRSRPATSACAARRAPSASPTTRAGLEAYSERWRPWRRYAAHYLWAAGA